MTNKFPGYTARRLYHIAELEHESRKNNDDLRLTPCSAANSGHFANPKTHPSWVYLNPARLETTHIDESKVPSPLLSLKLAYRQLRAIILMYGPA